MRKRIKFIRSYNHYFQGDIAGFQSRLADNLVRKGIAIPYSDEAISQKPPAPVEESVPPAPEPVEEEDSAKDDLMKMKLRELQEIAEELGISSTGTKSRLVKRILEAMQDAE
jgi:hypothetical protein